MAKPPNSDTAPDSKPDLPPFPSPKRGAIPSPKADIERAKPYRIETDPAKDDDA
jgi:hypothetical protein